MVGVVEAVAFADLPASCAPAESTGHTHAPNATEIKDTFRIAAYPHPLRETILVFAVPADKSDEQTDSHDSQSQVHMPAVQHCRRHNRAPGGNDQQQGSLALRQSLLFDHSAFTFRRRQAPSASRRRFFSPALSSP